MSDKQSFYEATLCYMFSFPYYSLLMQLAYIEHESIIGKRETDKEKKGKQNRRFGPFSKKG